MARLPTPGSDDGTWGDILNTFLKTEHNPDGSQKPLSQSTIIDLEDDLAAKIADNDSRLSDQRVPLDDSVTNAKVSATAAIDQSKIADLTDDLGSKATDATVVHLAGAETILGAKTFNANTFLDKGSQVYNVKAYGAAGDGVVDDTAAIQAAIDGVARGRGYSVFIPRGIYKITSSLIIPGSVRIYGEGAQPAASEQGGSELRWSGSTVGTVVQTAIDAQTDYSRGRIEDIRISSAITPVAGSVGLDIRNPQNGGIIKNVFVTGGFEVGIKIHSSKTTPAYEPGYFKFDRCWVVGGVYPWLVKTGAEPLVFDTCATDADASTIDMFRIESSISGAAVRSPIILQGCKFESNSPASDCNGVHVTVPATVIATGVYVHRYNGSTFTSTKDAFRYTGTGSHNISLIGCCSTGMVNWFNDVTASNTIAPSALGTPFQSSLMNFGLGTTLSSNNYNGAPANPLGLGFPFGGDILSFQQDTAAFGGSNRTQYVRAVGGGTISSLIIFVGNSSGSISAGVYANSGSGRSSVPGARKATTGAIACPTSGTATLSLGGSVTVNPGDWFALSCDNTTATFGRRGTGSVISSVLLNGVFAREGVHPVPVNGAASTGIVDLALVIVGA